MKNRIPRNFNTITARQLLNTSGGVSGDIWTITRDKEKAGYHGKNTRTNKEYFIFYSHMRIKELYEIISIV